MTPEHRHQQPGRRKTDVDDFAKAAMVEAVVVDRMFPSWRKEDVIKWLTLLSLLGTVFVGVSTWFSARFATRAEIEEQVKPVVDTLNALKIATDSRMRRLEARQDTLYNVRQLIPAMARAQCLQLERWDSKTIAEAAGLPCDSLLRRNPR